MYVPDIQQGNVLEIEKVQQLKLGLTKQQVNFLLGTPLLKDPFHVNRWDYIHTLTKSNKVKIIKTITLHFNDNVLVKINK